MSVYRLMYEVHSCLSNNIVSKVRKLDLCLGSNAMIMILLYMLVLFGHFTRHRCHDMHYLSSGFVHIQTKL